MPIAHGFSLKRNRRCDPETHLNLHKMLSKSPSAQTLNSSVGEAYVDKC